MSNRGFGCAAPRDTTALELWLPAGPTTLALMLRPNTDAPPLATATVDAKADASEVTLRAQ